MPGAAQGVANVQGITGIEYRRLERRAGRFEPSVIAAVRKAVAWMLDLEAP
jgi:mRNA-degrading endonuclease toxin of MazEF toxin-antitoxin module